MPKKLLINPNERVDLVDFRRASYEYAEEADSSNRRLLVQSGKSLVSHGFRVELADQTVSPGQLTVYNGAALDRNGKLLTNEQQVNDARTVSLLGTSGTFYLEVEYAEAESNVDSRAFWDPTFTGTIPNGKEYGLNVATRSTPDWKIVSPIRTGDFEVDTDSNSTKIPIGYFETGISNEITNVTLVKAATVLAEDVLSGATVFKVLDSSLFPDSGTSITVGASAGLSLVSNDRANNILTTVGGVTGDTNAGDIVVNSAAATATFVPESIEASPTSGADRRLVLFKGDEIKGSALMASKETTGGKDDLDIRSLKDYADFKAGLMRELKFGSPRPDVTSTLPPADFSSTRYFDAAGSIAGNKTVGVTIGDGVTSYGHLNDQNLAAAINAAIAANAGSIYVQQGEYEWDATVTISQPTSIEFDPGVTWAAGGTYSGSIAITGLDAVSLTGLPDMSAEHSLRLTIASGFGAFVQLDSCFFSGLTHVLSADALKLRVTNCVFNKIEDSAASVLILVNSSVPSDCIFDFCTISYSYATDTSATLISGGMENAKFRDCIFDLAASTGSADSFAAPVSSENVIFDRCNFMATNPSSASYGLNFSIGTQQDSIHIKSCTFDFDWDSGLGFAPVVILFGSSVMSDHLVENCDFSDMSSKSFPSTSAPSYGAMIRFENSVNFSGAHRIVNNLFGGSSSPGFVNSIHVRSSSTKENAVVISGNQFSSFRVAVKVDTNGSAIIENNQFAFSNAGLVLTDLVAAVEVADSFGYVSILGNNINISLPATLAATVSGVFAVSSKEIIVSNNNITVESGVPIGVSTAGRSIATEDTNILITGNHITVESPAPFISANGIYVNVLGSRYSLLTVSSNNIKVFTSTDVAADLVGIYLASSSSPEEVSSSITNNTVVIGGEAVYELPSITGIFVTSANLRCSDNSVNTYYGGVSRGIGVLAHDNVVISSNTVLQTWDNAQSVATGDVDDSHCLQLYVSTAGTRTGVIVDGNILEGGTATGTVFGVSWIVSSARLDGLSISNNTLISNTDAITNLYMLSLTSGTATIPGESFSINNNTFINKTSGASDGFIRPINMTGNPGNFVDVVISDNIVTGNSVTSDRLAAIFLSYCSSALINGNMLTTWGSVGSDSASIAVSFTSALVIMNNFCGSVNPAEHSILCASCTGGVIKDNYVAFIDGGSFPYSVIEAIPANVTIAANYGPNGLLA